MQDRFKFNAVVSSYYDIDTPEEYKEVEPQFYLKNVDVFCTGEIGIDYDTLLEEVKQQAKDLTEKEIGQIMQHFEDNSNSPECDYVTITPDKIIQCTGLKDKNGNLIYEGDIVSVEYEGRKYIATIDYDEDDTGFGCNYHFRENGELCSIAAMDIYGTVIDNIYQNQEPIERITPMINKKLSEIINKCYEINKSGKYTLFCWYSGHCNVIDINYTKGEWKETKEQVYIARSTEVNEKNLEKILEQLNSLK